MASALSESPPGPGPDSPPPGAQALSDLATPGLWRRMACWMYEGVLLFAVLFMGSWLFSTLTQMRNAIDPQRHLLQQGFLFLLLGVYFTWFWSRGQTLAMKTWGVRVVDRHGRRPHQGRALLRYLLAWLWFLPPLAVASVFSLPPGESTVIVIGWVVVWALLSRFHPQGQFWHDALAGTRLVRADPRST